MCSTAGGALERARGRHLFPSRAEASATTCEPSPAIVLLVLALVERRFIENYPVVILVGTLVLTRC